MSKTVVKPLFVGPTFRTNVWLSDGALGALAEYQASGDKDGEAGFIHHEGKSQKNKRQFGIRPKENYPHILGIQPFGLFRIYGFYEQPNKKCFVGVTYTWKKDQKMRDRDKEAADEAAAIRASGDWEKEVA